MELKTEKKLYDKKKAWAENKEYIFLAFIYILDWWRE